jgi:superfamily II DNA or RNA helicase
VVLDEFKIAALVEGSIDEVLVISDIQLATDHCIQLKEEQDKAVRDLLKGKYVIAVLPTGYGKSLIYQAFLRAREYQTSGKAAIIVISPLNSIYIKDPAKRYGTAMFLVRVCLNHYNYYIHYS